MITDGGRLAPAVIMDARNEYGHDIAGAGFDLWTSRAD
jgi:hypothetical protein